MPANLKRRLVVGGLWATGGKLLGGLAVIAINALLTRLLSPGDFGSYALLTSYVLVLATVVQLGLQQSSVKLIAASNAQGSEVNAQSMTGLIGLIGLVVLTIFGCLHYWFFGEWFIFSIFGIGPSSIGIGIVTAWLVIFAFQSILAEIYRGFHDIREATLLKGVCVPVLVLLVLAYFYSADLSLDLSSIVLIVVSSSVLVVIGFVTHIVGSKGIRLGLDKSKVREILAITMPLWITSSTLVVLTQADIWVLGAFRSAEEVGIYGAATRLIVLIGMPMLVVNSVVAPMVAELFSKGSLDVLERMVRGTVTLAFIVAMPIALLFVFASERVMTLIYGSYYADGGVILAILTIGQLLNVVSGSCGIVLMMTGAQMVIMRITLLCGTLGVVGALSVVGWGGATAVAVVAAGSLTLQNILMMRAVHKRLGILTIPTLKIDVGKLWSR